MKRLALILCSLFIVSGCTYHAQSEEPVTPVTYQGSLLRSPESVGRLRRLAIMPVELQVYVGKYASSKAQAEAARHYQLTCGTFLSEKKGYEIISINDQNGKWQDHVSQQIPTDTDQSLYTAWQAESAGKHSAPLIRRLGHALNVDGLLVIWIKEKKPWDTIDGISNIALMNIPLFYHMSSPAMGAWIYETASGSMVWSEEHTTMGNEVIDATSLFLEIENAVPHQLIE